MCFRTCTSDRSVHLIPFEPFTATSQFRSSDFNVAIHYSERRLHTSVAGSMAYMAPEVIGKRGYSWNIDWWSLGITAYELVFHKRPFDGRNAEKMTNSILNDTLEFPPDSRSRCSAEGLKVIRGVCLHPSSTNSLLISTVVHRAESESTARMQTRRSGRR
jgi:serine/threonine protein kinase